MFNCFNAYSQLLEKLDDNEVALAKLLSAVTLRTPSLVYRNTLERKIELLEHELKVALRIKNIDEIISHQKERSYTQKVDIIKELDEILTVEDGLICGKECTSELIEFMVEYKSALIDYAKEIKKQEDNSK